MAANAYGLYDMHGNAREWSADCWNPNFRGAPDSEVAWLDGDCSKAVIRGGSWEYGDRDVRSANRAGARKSARRNSYGFRVARTID